MLDRVIEEIRLTVLANHKKGILLTEVIVFLCPDCDNIHIHITGLETHYQFSLVVTAQEAEEFSKQLLNPQLAKPEDFV